MNVFLVTSPFQYICALEAIHFYSCSNNILLLINQKSKHGLAQQHKLVRESDWDHIIAIDRGNRSFSIPKAIKQIKKTLNGQTLEKFFYAEYNAWWTKLLIRNLSIEEQIYFDDGTLTLLEYYQHIVPKTEFYRPRFLQDLVVRLNGCKPIGRLAQSKKLSLFTLFSLENSHTTISPNTLERLKEQYGHPELFDKAAPLGFIGQGAIGDKNQKTIKEYLDELYSLSKKTGQKIIYFPHRTEKEEIREALLNAENIIYHQSKLPLEIELIDKKMQLSALIGTFSTVMFTCRLLYPEMPIYTLSDKHPNEEFQKELRKQMKLINITNFDPAFDS
ncbi:glycosyltransferase 52 family protein [Vibrio sp. Isolate30]|jgi:hypothetical protein|uniref:glycosyltransferase 52 family protein n=1 Tax=Vibrio sp. Isolate30 TaxID=2908536 RepID=UPI001EFEA2F5|nr:glycosyltransferase 52 family protein [Vibrio sp. Isolate30]MCG9632616.1 glycosyltransferase 52 family protein [Vibrio sp. Isolate30]